MSDIEKAARLETAHARARLERELTAIFHSVSAVREDLADDAYTSMPARLSDVAAAATRAVVEAGRLAAIEDLKQAITPEDTAA